jgi:hypothetical protein
MTTKSVIWTTDQYGNSVRLVATADATGVHSRAKQAPTGSYAAELAEYNKHRGIDRLMRGRHGVNM